VSWAQNQTKNKVVIVYETMWVLRHGWRFDGRRLGDGRCSFRLLILPHLTVRRC